MTVCKYALFAVFAGFAVQFSEPALAQDCSAAKRERAAIEKLAEQDSKSALKRADRLSAQSPTCLDTQMALAKALNARIDDTNPITALSLSRRYRKAIAEALRIAPSSVDARTEEIGYLIYAPGIAGGDTKKAARRIADLHRIDALAATQMEVALARQTGDNALRLRASRRLAQLRPNDLENRSALIRLLINANQYAEAEREWKKWPRTSSDQWARLERLYLGGAVRVLGKFDLPGAETMLATYVQARPSVKGRKLASQADAMALMGAAQEGQGKFAEAETSYRKTLNLERGNERAIDGMTRVKGRTQ